MRKLLLGLCLLLAVPAGLAAEQAASTEQDNVLLAQVLRHYQKHGFTVVMPDTRLNHGVPTDPKELAQSKRFIVGEFARHKLEVKALVDTLYARNMRPVRLTLKSAPDQGYLVDDGSYRKYFDHDGGGWERWYKEHPEAEGMTTVSLPAYDEKSGLLLVYIGTQRHWLDGAGYVVLFRLDKDGLHELGAVMMWIS